MNGVMCIGLFLDLALVYQIFPLEGLLALVTVEDGPEQYRQFYAEDVAGRAVRFTWLGKILNNWTRRVSNATGSWL